MFRALDMDRALTDFQLSLCVRIEYFGVRVCSYASL